MNSKWKKIDVIAIRHYDKPTTPRLQFSFMLAYIQRIIAIKLSLNYKRIVVFGVYIVYEN